MRAVGGKLSREKAVWLCEKHMQTCAILTGVNFDVRILINNVNYNLVI